jgi:nicotinamidase-related amidase
MTHPALAIIDMQNAYFRNEALAEQKESLLKHINELVEVARASNRPVFNVVTQHKKDQSTWTLNMIDDGEGYLFEGEKETQTVAGLAVEGVHPIIKTRDSAFFQTDFAKILAQEAIETIVLCGVSTHSCIFQTASDAYAHNYRVALARDAIASHDPSYHDTTFAQLTQEYRQPVLSHDAAIELLREAT